jgi:hypothetical protein
VRCWVFVCSARFHKLALRACRKYAGISNSGSYFSVLHLRPSIEVTFLIEFGVERAVPYGDANLGFVACIWWTARNGSSDMHVAQQHGLDGGEWVQICGEEDDTWTGNLALGMRLTDAVVWEERRACRD